MQSLIKLQEKLDHELSKLDPVKYKAKSVTVTESKLCTDNYKVNVVLIQRNNLDRLECQTWEKNPSIERLVAALNRDRWANEFRLEDTEDTPAYYFDRTKG